MTVTNQKENTNRLTRYFREVRAEMNKVIWPTRDQTVKLTVIVIAVMVAMALYLGLLDSIFGALVQQMLNRF